jgi:hypothetical protein
MVVGPGGTGYGRMDTGEGCTRHLSLQQRETAGTSRLKMETVTQITQLRLQTLVRTT